MSAVGNIAGGQPLPLRLISQSLPMLSRGVMEDLIERLIDQLDIADGDPDMEDYNADDEDDDPASCDAGDDGLHPVIVRGQVHWGSEWDGADEACLHYRMDQTEPVGAMMGRVTVTDDLIL